MLINKRLISAVKEKRFHIAGNKICQWVSLAANIAMMGAVVRLLQKLCEGIADGRQIGVTAVIAVVTVVVPYALLLFWCENHSRPEERRLNRGRRLWIISRIAVLLAVLAFAILRAKMHFKGGGCCGSGSNSFRDKKALTAPKIGETVLTVEGIHCENCCRFLQQGSLRRIAERYRGETWISANTDSRLSSEGVERNESGL